MSVLGSVAVCHGISIESEGLTISPLLRPLVGGRLLVGLVYTFNDVLTR